MPEPYVVQPIAAALGHCATAMSPCHAIDLGGNVGIHAAYMASLGAFLDVVEPQTDLAAAIQRTMTVNCWSHRVIVHNAAVSPDIQDHGRKFRLRAGWRLEDTGLKVSRNFEVPFVSLPKLLTGRIIDLIKIDIDSFEYALLTAMEQLIAARSTTVRAILVEIQRYHARRAYSTLESLHRLQKMHGYTVYRMSHAVYSPVLERWYTRCHGLRSIKHALKVSRTLSATEWGELLSLKQDSALGRAETTTILLTTEKLGDAKWHGMNEATAKEVVGSC